jgi:hypothetical protein
MVSPRAQVSIWINSKYQMNVRSMFCSSILLYNGFFNTLLSLNSCPKLRCFQLKEPFYTNFENLDLTQTMIIIMHMLTKERKDTTLDPT